ncbi:MAG: LamG-like jellyroll fold domain-containing protein [Planctomycetota bacterium]
MDDQTKAWVIDLIDGQISDADFESLQSKLARDPEARRYYVQSVGITESLASLAGTESSRGTVLERGGETRSPRSAGTWVVPTRPLVLIATLAACRMVVGSVAWMAWLKNANATLAKQPETAVEVRDDETRLSGHATLRRSVGIDWAKGASVYREGDVLPEGVLSFQSGLAEIDFFCGASVVIEGPAKLQIENDWAAFVELGRMRVQVPPAAQGFVLRTQSSEVVDLGTEFAVEVSEDRARVQVLDGEVVLRGGTHDGVHLLDGQSQVLLGEPKDFEGLGEMVSVRDMESQRDELIEQRLANWRETIQVASQDPRMIAYYPIGNRTPGRVVNDAAHPDGSRDGLILGPVDETRGRLGPKTSALEFHRPGARVRTRIEGEFAAFSFACWVKIDSLEHTYNALFMGDGYENGEPHWQIRDDGRLMISVMIDDSQKIRRKSRVGGEVVWDNGVHRVYFSEPIWSVANSGQWMHLVSVYDPGSRRVAHYVNGQNVSEHEIVDPFFTDTLRIGAAEIGNWGQPFRDSPWFSVRNLNGAIDELAIYNAALTSHEITMLFEEGKPLGY